MLNRLREKLLNHLDKVNNKLHEIESDNDAFDLHRIKGNSLVDAGDFVQAEVAYRKAFLIRPADSRTLIGLGYVLSELGRLVEARVYLQRVITSIQDDVLLHEPLYILGVINEKEGHPEDAVKCFTKALEYKPDFEIAWGDLCRVLFLTRRPVDALTAVSKGLAINPSNPDFHFYAGNLHLEAGRYQAAVDSYLQALGAGAQGVSIHSSLGMAYSKLGNETAAVQSFKNAQVLDPTIAEAQYQSGCAFLKQGNIVQAIANFEMAVALQPDFWKAHSNLLVALCLDSSGSLDRYQQAVMRYNTSLKTEVGADLYLQHVFTEGDCPRPLKVGFVSGDFKAHPVGFFLEGILREIDPQRVRLLAYSNTSNQDQVTRRLKQLFAEWTDTSELSDSVLAAHIAEHQVDILIDLAGHTVEHRLPVFARHPAKVQVTWLGYFASTGLTSMDYILVDPVCSPESSAEYFSEKRWYLPYTRLCMTPPALPNLEISPAPSLAKGVITFGSFQAMTKLSSHVLTVWSRVLAAVPGSELRLQIPQLDIADNRKELLRRLDEAGIESQRVILSAGTHWEDYLKAYKHVDILMDTFPFNGGTTTAEALWMGVPTITLRGNTMLSRQGASMLTCVGMQEWIAEDENQFVSKAVQFSVDLRVLQELRSGLRDRALNSPLFNTRLFAHHFQDALEAMYSDARKGHDQ